MSDLETELEFQIRAYRLPPPLREYRFDPARRWRFDFAWPQKRVALEVEGGVWSGGRHTRGSGFISDCEKYNTATLAGWKVFRVTGEHVRSGVAVDLAQKALLTPGPAVPLVAGPESLRT